MKYFYSILVAFVFISNTFATVIDFEQCNDEGKIYNFLNKVFVFVHYETNCVLFQTVNNASLTKFEWTLVAIHLDAPSNVASLSNSHLISLQNLHLTRPKIRSMQRLTVNMSIGLADLKRMLVVRSSVRWLAIQRVPIRKRSNWTNQHKR